MSATALEIEPGLRADQTLSGGQRVAGVVVLAVLGVALVLAPRPSLVALVGLAIVLYLSVFVDRMLLLRGASTSSSVISISDADARAVPDDELPVYTVLVPAYREPDVVPQLVDSLGRLDYPHDRLDVRLLLEEDDGETYEAARRLRAGPWLEIVRVPYSEPRTKPKACNYGLTDACGDLVTIYDAEDRPDPLQLRRAAVAFRRVDPSVACLQAKLSYHNGAQNLITKWFAVEYLMWFTYLLPGLVRRDVPIPLGGTSNHFRADVLRRLGGWDPFNVTEDADLGVRLHRFGLRTRVLDSVTEEEANSDFVNWVKQRSRWYKGYMQTWLVHMRHPVDLFRRLGPRGFLSFQLFVGGTPLFAVLNPVFWGLTLLWFFARLDFISTLFPTAIYYGGLCCLAVGNFAFLYASMLVASRSGRPSLVIAALLTPLYWIMMSLAGLKALWQLATAPSFWEKTVHGLNDEPVVEAVANPSGAVR